MRQSVPKLHSFRPKTGPLAEPPVPVKAHSWMTAKQALLVTVKERPQDVLIFGYDAEGRFFNRSSHFTREQALWLIEHARRHILNED